MKVNISYCICINKTIEVTPKEYCELQEKRTCTSKPDVFPNGCWSTVIEPNDDKDRRELDKYIWDKK